MWKISPFILSIKIPRRKTTLQSSTSPVRLLSRTRLVQRALPLDLIRERFEGSTVEILGWGTTMVAGPVSDTLMKARMVAQNITHCKAHYPKVDSSQVCTYGEDADACQRDSGGPVLWQHPDTKRLVVIGIISYGTFCATEEPGVNTYVGAYLDWIRRVTPGINYCPLY